MVMQERSQSLIQDGGSYAVPMELYTSSRIRSGQFLHRIGPRELDVLNGAIAVSGFAKKSEYIKLSNCTRLDSTYQQNYTVYVKKSAIHVAAIIASEAKEGEGTNRKQNYPFMRKHPVAVSLDLGRYTIAGNMHCLDGQTIQDVLEDPRVFVPLTSVTITSENNLEYTRPFAAVNKNKIESVQEL